MLLLLSRHNATRVPVCKTVKNLSYRRLQKNELSKCVKHSAIRSFDVNFLGSNPQIEDRFVTGFSRTLGMGFFSVIDGHKGFMCSDFLQSHLLQTVASTLQTYVDTGRKLDMNVMMDMNFTLISDSHSQKNCHFIDMKENSVPKLPDSIIEKCLAASFKSMDEYISSQALRDVKDLMQGHSLTLDMKKRIIRALEGACVTLAMVQTNSISVATTGDCRVVNNAIQEYNTKKNSK